MNTVILDFSLPHTKDAIIRLHEDKIIDIKFWLGYDSELYKRIDIIGYDNIYSYLYENRCSFCDEKLYKKVYQYIGAFINMESRWCPTIETDKYNHLFNLYINFWYHLFRVNSIELVIEGGIPHGGIGFIAYKLAEFMGIKTLCVMQTIFPGKFLCCKKIDKLGYQEFPAIGNWQYTKIKRSYKKDLYYMENIKPYLGATRISLWQSIKDIYRQKENIIGKFSKYGILGFDKIGEKIGYQLIDSYLEKRFKKYVRTYNFSDIDKNISYVYFPLHLQPEMTTDTLGGYYSDQLLAIERLCELIPDDWAVYVKDNPKQTYYKRNDMFFKRLLSLKKVRLIGYKENTHQLIESAQFVATINGTVGWEAISGGKNVLIFGYAWYRTFPGVFEYSLKPTLEEIMNYKIDHVNLEKIYNEYMKTLFDGVIISENMEKSDPEYSVKKNNMKVFASLRRAILTYDKMNGD